MDNEELSESSTVEQENSDLSDHQSNEQSQVEDVAVDNDDDDFESQLGNFSQVVLPLPGSAQCNSLML